MAANIRAVPTARVGRCYMACTAGKVHDGLRLWQLRLRRLRPQIIATAGLKVGGNGGRHGRGMRRGYGARVCGYEGDLDLVADRGMKGV